MISITHGSDSPQLAAFYKNAERSEVQANTPQLAAGKFINPAGGAATSAVRSFVFAAVSAFHIRGFNRVRGDVVEVEAGTGAGNLSEVGREL